MLQQSANAKAKLYSTLELKLLDLDRVAKRGAERASAVFPKVDRGKRDLPAYTRNGLGPE